MEWPYPIVLESALRTVGLSVREFLSPQYAVDNGSFYEVEWHGDGWMLRGYPHRGLIHVEADLSSSARLVRHGQALECDKLTLPETTMNMFPMAACSLFDHEFLKDRRIKIVCGTSMVGQKVKGNSDRRTDGVRLRLKMPCLPLPEFSPRNVEGWQ